MVHRGDGRRFRPAVSAPGAWQACCGHQARSCGGPGRLSCRQHPSVAFELGLRPAPQPVRRLPVPDGVVLRRREGAGPTTVGHPAVVDGSDTDRRFVGSHPARGHVARRWPDASGDRGDCLLRIAVRPGKDRLHLRRADGECNAAVDGPSARARGAAGFIRIVAAAVAAAGRSTVRARDFRDRRRQRERHPGRPAVPGCRARPGRNRPAGLGPSGLVDPVGAARDRMVGPGAGDAAAVRPQFSSLHRDRRHHDRHDVGRRGVAGRQRLDGLPASAESMVARGVRIRHHLRRGSRIRPGGGTRSLGARARRSAGPTLSGAHVRGRGRRHLRCLPWATRKSLGGYRPRSVRRSVRLPAQCLQVPAGGPTTDGARPRSCPVRRGLVAALRSGWRGWRGPAARPDHPAHPAWAAGRAPQGRRAAAGSGRGRRDRRLRDCGNDPRTCGQAHSCRHIP